MVFDRLHVINFLTCRLMVLIYNKCGDIMDNRSNFIKTIMAQDLESGKQIKSLRDFHQNQMVLHIGHARAIIINFSSKHLAVIQTYV